MKRTSRRDERQNARTLAFLPGTQTVHADLLGRALHWAITDDVFHPVRKHGNTTWLPRSLIVQAIFWVWSSCHKLTDGFDEARQLSERVMGSAAIGSYQGLTQALLRYTPQFMPLLWQRLRTLMQECGAEHWRIGSWLPLAVDGSRATTPRTKSNEQVLGAANYGQGRMARSRRKWKNKRRRTKCLGQPVKPQIWMTLLWHMGLKVPWAWQCGPSNASERSHFRQLLETQSFPENTLFCGDAGFVGFTVWKAILDGGHNFLMRVGGNLQLLNDLGRVRQGNGLVHFWPRAAYRQGLGPLTLRLIEFQTARGPLYLVTNVLSDRLLTLTQAKRLYRLRWGVEVQFRSLKQTFGRGKLRSRTPQRALMELEWSLVGLWLVQLFAVKEQIAIDAPPERSSVSLALGVIRRAMRCWSAPATSPHILRDGFRVATLDTYRRRLPKQGRYRPSAQDIPWTTKPIIRAATKKQKQTYSRLLNIAA